MREGMKGGQGERGQQEGKSWAESDAKLRVEMCVIIISQPTNQLIQVSTIQKGSASILCPRPPLSPSPITRSVGCAAWYKKITGAYGSGVRLVQLIHHVHCQNSGLAHSADLDDRCRTHSGSGKHIDVACIFVHQAVNSNGRRY